jgi:hypothetical protein
MHDGINVPWVLVGARRNVTAGQPIGLKHRRRNLSPAC